MIHKNILTFSSNAYNGKKSIHTYFVILSIFKKWKTSIFILKTSRNLLGFLQLNTSSMYHLLDSEFVRIGCAILELKVDGGTVIVNTIAAQIVR